MQLSTPEALESFVKQLPCDIVLAASRVVSEDFATIGFDEVKSATRPLLYLAQAYQELYTADTQQDGQEQQTGFSNTMKQLYDKVLHAVDRNPASAANNATSYVCSLRAIVLKLKMLQLLTSIKLSNLTLETAITSLRSAVAQTSQDLAKHMQQMTGNVTAAFHCQKAQALTATAIRLGLQVSKQMPRSKSAVGSAGVRAWTAELLQHLMPSHVSGNVEAAACTVVSSGVCSLSMLHCIESACLTLLLLSLPTCSITIMIIVINHHQSHAC